MITGFKKALELKAYFIAKIDSDDQMDPGTWIALSEYAFSLAVITLKRIVLVTGRAAVYAPETFYR